MSLYIDFEPHSWYMGFAIKSNLDIKRGHKVGYMVIPRWQAYTDNGNFYRVDRVESNTLNDLKKKIRQYHLQQKNGYGECIAKKRLEYLRGEIEAERISYGEMSKLESLKDYINAGDVQLLEWAGILEGAES